MIVKYNIHFYVVIKFQHFQHRNTIKKLNPDIKILIFRTKIQYFPITLFHQIPKLSITKLRLYKTERFPKTFSDIQKTIKPNRYKLRTTVPLTLRKPLFTSHVLFQRPCLFTSVERSLFRNLSRHIVTEMAPETISEGCGAQILQRPRFE